MKMLITQQKKKETNHQKTKQTHIQICTLHILQLAFLLNES